MNRQYFNELARLILVLVVAAIPLTGGLAHAQVVAQPQETASSQKCDGTARSGNTQGQMRSISNCDRKAAAQRAAERRAAVRKVAAPLPKGGKQ